MFPATYVEEIVESATPPARNTPLSPRTLPTPPQPKAQTAVAVYDFKAESTAELGLRAGDVITLSQAVAGADWWSGRLADGRQGMFPSTYVQLQ